LIEALLIHGLGEWAQFHPLYELTLRGPPLVDDIARSLIAQSLGLGVGWLSESLVQIFQHEPSAPAQVVRRLIEAGEAALTAGD
jgi:hypothetical protein